MIFWNFIFSVTLVPWDFCTQGFFLFVCFYTFTLFLCFYLALIATFWNFRFWVMLFSFTRARFTLSVCFVRFHLYRLVGNVLVIKKKGQKSRCPHIKDMPPILNPCDVLYSPSKFVTLVLGHSCIINIVITVFHFCKVIKMTRSNI